jgi:hypothetical protein
MLNQKLCKMKKAYLLVVIFLVPFLLQGQGVGIGIKAGANFANQDVKDISVKSVTDYLAGAYVNINFSDKWGITPEVLYTAYGSEVDNLKLDLDYVAIPVMLRFKPISLISLEAGPQFSFLTKANYNGSDFMDQLKNNDFGLAFGAGLHLPLGLNAGVRYVLGFTDINDVSSESIKNRTFQVYAGWTIFGAK